MQTPTTISETYSYTAGTNRLASVVNGSGTRSITYDGRGNTASESRPGSVAVSTSYDGYGRLLTYTRTGDPSQANGYNGLDDRVSVTSGGTTHSFVYDPDGRMIGEYGTSATDVIAETIWLNPEVAANGNQPLGGDDSAGGYAPLAVVTGSGASTALYWVHGNHLGVPIVTTDASGAAASPTGFTMVGFPGQTRTLADLYYNRYRDYDSGTGRYIQADPIGLDGDVNPYVYALNNPLRFTDPMGLNAVWAIRGAEIGGEIAGEGLWLLCQRFPTECMATIGGAAVWVYHTLHPSCPDQAPVLEMAQRGKQRIDNDYTRYIMNNRIPPDDRCKVLREMLRKETDAIRRRSL